MNIRRIGLPATNVTPTSSPTDETAYWFMPNGKASAYGVSTPVPPTATWIGLDPGRTSPFVQIGADVPGLGPSLLTPGAVLPLPKNCRPLALWNVLHALSAGSSYGGYNPITAKVPHQFGRASLVVGDDAALPAWLAYANRVTAGPPKVSAVLSIAVPLNDIFYFPTLGMKAYRITAFPADANGAPVAGAGFSVTLRKMWRPTAAQGMKQAYGDVLDNHPQEPLSIFYSVETGAGTTLTLDAIGSCQFAEVAVAAPVAREGYIVSALAGAGVVTALLSIEGC